jgi:RNA polymerase sigma-70 factor (ECF subfamily)
MVETAKQSAGTVVQITEDDPDVALMLRLKSGDDKAFAAIFSKYEKRIVNYARRYLYNRERAEDAAQETFLRLYRARGDYEPRTRFRTYLYRIATNTCLNHVRKREWLSKDVPDVADSQAQPEEALAGAELRTLVEKALAELPEAQRTALVLLRFEDLSYEEIAQVTDASVAAVKSLLNRAKAQLLQKLGPHMSGFTVPYKKEAP